MNPISKIERPRRVRNSFVERRFDNKSKKNFVGCASNHFNLAVKYILSEYEDIIDQTNDAMKNLGRVILKGGLRKFTNLRPKRKKDTRWSSCFKILKRFIEIREFLPNLKNEELDKIIPTPQFGRKVEKLCKHMEIIESVTKELQSEKTKTSEVRVLFDNIIEKFPIPSDRISSDAAIIHHFDFESEVYKILDNQAG